mmetsp:Transcript_33097/g.105479  ORF Transcript_33097/g.105479 Transcript_33097/m.105479 type:complete len:219 (+) Transcript_33097:543-1199(+)
MHAVGRVKLHELLQLRHRLPGLARPPQAPPQVVEYLAVLLGFGIVPELPPRRLKEVRGGGRVLPVAALVVAVVVVVPTPVVALLARPRRPRAAVQPLLHHHLERRVRLGALRPVFWGDIGPDNLRLLVDGARVLLDAHLAPYDVLSLLGAVRLHDLALVELPLLLPLLPRVVEPPRLVAPPPDLGLGDGAHALLLRHGGGDPPLPREARTGSGGLLPA